MNNNFYKKNREKYLENVENFSISLFFSGRAFQKTADQDFEFEAEKNFYYLTGINQENVILALIREKDNYKTDLFIEKNDPVLVKWVGKKLEIEEAKQISGINDVHYHDEFDTFIFSVFNSSRKSLGSLKTLYLNLERRNNKSYTNLALEYSKQFKKEYPEVHIKNSYLNIVEQRMLKTNEELQLIKDAVSVTNIGLKSILKNLKPGLTEYQMEAHFDFQLKYSSNLGAAFKTIAASGKNATILHYVNNDSVLQDGDLILFDLGSRKDFYISDISRTYPVNGKFNKRQKEVYEEVLKVNKKCIEFLKPGITWVEYNEYARNLLIEASKRLGLIKEDKEISKYYYHTIGHSIGLDTHDPANHALAITEGMVLTVEPGLYIEEEKIGIRIEDNVLITRTGCENLSIDIIKEVKDIENFMAAK